MTDYAELVKRLEARQLLHVQTGLGFYSQADARLDKAAADAIERQDARIAELEAMVKNAYNAGFIEGMKEHTHSQGGIPWRDSKFRAALESK